MRADRTIRGVATTRFLFLAVAGALLAGSAAADTVTLTWTAPGDDGNTGRAYSYDLRYSTQAVAGGDTASWWGTAQSVGALPPPLTSGSPESFTLSGLPTGAVYYFVIRTSDESSNVSGFSNVAQRQAGSSGGALATVSGFTVRPVTGGALLDWEEPSSGAGEGYRLYRRNGDGGPDSLLVTLPVSRTTWTDSTVAGGASYTYQLATFRSAEEGPPAVATVSIPVDRLVSTERAIRGFPNPARGRVTLRFPVTPASGNEARVRVIVYDLTGRKIAELLDGVVAAGPRTLEWNCRTAGGRPVAPGLYNVILDGPQGRMITRVAVVP